MRKITGASMLLWAVFAASAQSGLQIAWKQVAQAVSNAPGASPAVQRLPAASTAAPAVKVNRVAIAPVVIQGTVGGQICLGQLDIATYTDSGERTHAVPLRVDMQADHLPKLRFAPKDNDLCFQPLHAGEYPIRFTSTLPAADGTLRGAQVFVRVK